ncbi:serine/threonine-protein kinase [Janthinobacterium sp. LB3P118]|uniref:serine/threonine-protein kinase n=1 Tax=Janthinobacterium sp. LB3P118 TaxID=3424195 RepID=UPI003F247B5F
MILPSRYEATGIKIGGGMGDIYVCLDRNLNRKVVLKVLKNGEEDRRLIDERKALIKLRSKHVVQLFDIVNVGGDSFERMALILEYIDGEDLRVGMISPGLEHLNVLWQISRGLSEIHNAGIIHRDIKPSNIRRDSSGVVKILDFGLAREEGLDAKTISAVGTPGFMAPELWKRTEVSFDKSIDVYAFGLLALALVDAEIPQGMFDRPPKRVERNSLSGKLELLPNDVVDILEKCLSYSPIERPLIGDIEFMLRRHLLKTRHRALLVLNSEIHEINSVSTSALITSAGRGVIGIEYDGLKFSINHIAGHVLVNNDMALVGCELPACCVITFGANQSDREFVTFDVSNPEVMP